MRSSILTQFIESITDEDRKEFERNNLEFLARKRHLEEQGYEYNTDKSHSLKLLNNAGYFPIGITYYACEETFIFRNKKEAKTAWLSKVLGFGGWFYGIDQFKKELINTDNYKYKIYWLWR